MMSTNSSALSTAQSAVDSLKNVLHENLASCVLYGSAVRGEMIPGRSDINLLIVLECSAPETHRALAEQLRKHPEIAPFVLSRWELPRSRRVFALKFLSIARNFKVLHGFDPLADFTPSEGLLHFLCEQSLRNLRLRLKHAYLRHAHNPELCERELLRLAPSMFVTISEVLRCAGVEVPTDIKGRVQVIGQQLGEDGLALTELRVLKQNPRRLGSEELFQMHARLFRLLSAALDKVRQTWPQALDMK